jgi:hypothetical protein
MNLWDFWRYNMEEKRYQVLIDNEVIASNMDLNIATVLAKALFEEYYNDCTMVVSIREEERTVCAE